MNKDDIIDKKSYNGIKSYVIHHCKKIVKEIVINHINESNSF